MRSTSIRIPVYVKRSLFGGAILLIVFALILIGFSRREASADTRRVRIDFLPGKASKTLDLSSTAPVPVAIYSTPEFDASTIDPSTVSVSGASVTKRRSGKLRSYSKDMNGDSLSDLVVYIEAQSLRLGEESTEALFTASTFDGKPVSGSGTAQIAASSGNGEQAGKQLSPQVRTFTGGSITGISGGAGTPYPSAQTIAVSTSAIISKLTVSLTGFTHQFPDDVDILLVAPNNTNNIILSDVGGGNPGVTSVNLTLDDAAASSLPDNSPFASGTFKPTDVNDGIENFVQAGIGPPGPYNSMPLSVFNGLNVNGTWNLWVKDDSAGDTGNITSWALNITFGPTLARMSGGSAVVDDDGLVELKWQTGHEVDNLGFNIYREEGGQKTRVNKQLIAGSALIAGQGTSMTAGRNYRWRDTTARPGQAAQYWIEAKDLNGSTLLSGPFAPAYSPGKLAPHPPSSTLGDLNRAGSSGKVSIQGASVQPAASGQTAFKVGVKEDGYYRVNQAELVTAGLNSGIDPRNLRLLEDGVERPMFIQGEQDGRLDSSDWIEFYGRAPDNAFTDTHVYQLVAGSEPGLRIKRAKGKGKNPAGDSFLFTTELSEKTIYFAGFSNDGKEKFFGPVVAREPVQRNLRLQNVARDVSSPATLEVGLQGVTAVPHNVRVRFNGADVGAVTFEGKSSGNAQMSVAQSSLKEGDNSIELIAEGGESDVSLVGAIRLSYWHSYTADDDSLQFTTPGASRLKITGFSSSSVRVLDVTDADSGGVREVSGTVIQEGGGYSISVNVPKGETRTLLAFGSNRVRNPASIAADIPSSWRQRNNKADLVIFTRADFIPALEPLKAHRESQGYIVAVVDVEDAYDEFSYGNKTPNAIRDFLANATEKWKVKPRFAIFAGDSSFDPKNYLGGGAWDIVPTKLIETKYLETASDDFFVDFDGNGIPEMAVGRLPVTSVVELSALIAKIVGYDSAAPSDTLLLVSDFDSTIDFEGVTGALRGLVPANFSTNELSRRDMDQATARAQLLDSLNAGQWVVNYFGHGSVDIWRDNLFTAEDASSLTNGNRLSLFVSMTCLNGYFHDPGLDSLGEAMLKARNGGAVSAWASSGMCSLEEQATMNAEFYRLLFGGALTVGEAAMKAKSSVQDMDVRRTWVLLGDPTTKLR